MKLIGYNESEISNYRWKVKKLSEIKGRAKHTAIRLFDYLESNPIIEIQKTANELDVSFNTAAKSVDRLIELKILAQSKKTGRARTFSYEAYLAILRRGTLPSR